MRSHAAPLKKSWKAALEEHVGQNLPEVDLTALRAGDRLRVVTRNTIYHFTMQEGRDAQLVTNRPNRPRGAVRIVGCAFGASTTIKPDALFCGGNLEFMHDDGAMTMTTSEITGLEWVRRV